jgi:hypothetical protein
LILFSSCEFTMNRALCPLVLASVALIAAAAPEEFDVAIDAGDHDRRESLVMLQMPPEAKAWKSIRLRDVGTDRTTPVQVIGLTEPVLAFFIRDLKAHSIRTFRMTPGASKSEAVSDCTCDDDGKGATLSVNGRKVLRYNSAMMESPAGLDPNYRRSGYIHPLFSPSGREITGDFAPDHAHQHALFFAWVNTTFDGRKTDFWNQQTRTGRVRHMEALSTVNGPVFAGFSVRLRHEALDGDNAKPALDEVWTVRAYRVEPDARQFVIDFESRQTCASPNSLQIHKYHYGGLGLRGNSAWFDPQAKGDDPPDPARGHESEFLTSEGKRRADGNHTRPCWLDLSGKLDGAFAGVAVLDDPRNFRFPQSVRLHPNKPYFAFSPSVEGEFRIEPGQTYISRYRIITHDGPPNAAALDSLWRDLAEPPSARIVPR